MKIPTLYLDTSVIGGYFDNEFKDATRELFKQAGIGLYEFFASVVTQGEVERAPDEVRNLFAVTFVDEAHLLPLTAEAEALAHAYIAAKVVPPQCLDDALHVAVATVEQISAIVSWNFKHLVNYRRESAFNGVNLLQGYRPVRIITPLELIYGDDEKENIDAVGESRQWKEDVTRKIAGMSTEQVLAFFNRDKALARMRAWRKKAQRSVSH